MVKGLADEAVRSGKCTIQDADDFMNWITNSSMKGVKFFFFFFFGTNDDYENIALKSQQVELEAVKGTLHLHAVRLNNDRKLCTLGMSCYCDECISGHICDSWTVLEAEKSNISKKAKKFEFTEHIL